VSFIPASVCAQVATIADSSNAWLGVAKAPTGCGWNDRRLDGADDE
jgi:hypothetical protein